MTHLDHRQPPDRARRKPNRSHSAVGAAIVAAAAMVAAFAFILTNGTSNTPSTDDSVGAGAEPGMTAPVETPSVDPAPSVKADRNPPATTASVRSPDTGPDSPAFRKGQWISVLDSYPSDAGMASDQLAKNLAAKLISAGVPAKAMLADGQYPGLSNSSLEPIRDTWIVYVGPTSSATAARAICESPKTQKAYRSPACPTFEPAKAG